MTISDYRRMVQLVSHMDLPDGVLWSKNGWYIHLRNGQWRWVCGLIDLENDVTPNLPAQPKPEEAKP